MEVTHVSQHFENPSSCALVSDTDSAVAGNTLVDSGKAVLWSLDRANFDRGSLTQAKWRCGESLATPGLSTLPKQRRHSTERKYNVNVLLSASTQEAGHVHLRLILISPPFRAWQDKGGKDSVPCPEGASFRDKSDRTLPDPS